VFLAVSSETSEPSPISTKEIAREWRLTDDRALSCWFALAAAAAFIARKLYGDAVPMLAAFVVAGAPACADTVFTIGVLNGLWVGWRWRCYIPCVSLNSKTGGNYKRSAGMTHAYASLNVAAKLRMAGTKLKIASIGSSAGT
jgi:hypothetical protein